MAPVKLQLQRAGQWGKEAALCDKSVSAGNSAWEQLLSKLRDNGLGLEMRSM